MGQYKESKLTIQMLTPLWMGGINGKMETFHATGIIGSLRWWYEAVIRGLGGSACDPDESPCTLDENKYMSKKLLAENERLKEAGLCDACQLFGATGWKRRFSLRVSDIPKNNNDLNSNFSVKPDNRNRGWFLSKGYMGQLNLSLTGKEDALLKIIALFRFLEKHGGIGAKQQLGYGLFKIIKIEGFKKDTNETFDSLKQNSPKIISHLPDLRTFTFFKVGFTTNYNKWWEDISGLKEISANNQTIREKEKQKILKELFNKNTVPISPIIKNHLRYDQRWSNSSLPHWFFGTLNLQNIGRVRSKIGISWAFKEGNEWKIRGWFYLPNDTKEKKYRKELLGVLQSKLENTSSWLDMLNLNAKNCERLNVNLLPLNSPWDIHKPNEILQLINNC